jgi:ABC-type nitrate/sulfonate/bicarbonate transport system substrate-binding protein
MSRLLVTLVAFVLVVTGCAPTGPASAPAAPASKPAASGSAGQAAAEPASKPARVDTVTVGFIPTLVPAQIYVGVEKGYFAEQNIEINIEVFTSGAEILTQTAAGRLDIGNGAAVGSAALNALATGVDVKILTTGHADLRDRPTTALMLRKVDGQPIPVAQLRGRKAAINSIGVSTEYTLAEGLRTAGLTLDDIDLVQLPFPDIVSALANGSIDAGVTVEPFVRRALQMGIAEPMTNITHENLQGTVTWINTNFARDRADVARRFMVAYLKSVRELQGEGFARDDIAAITSKYTRLEPEVIKAVWPPYFDPNGKVNVESIMEQQRFHLSRGSLKYTTPIDVRQHIDESFVEYAVQQLGPYRP